MPLIKPNNFNSSELDNNLSNSGLKIKYELPSVTKEERNNVITIKFPKSYEVLLRKHFENKGIPLSTGIRMILIDYLKENQIS
ncbi:MAG: hypothetical protein KA885_13445 [Spirochaetes bacterium]|nr:hypothetical protein [Spirochaetota bacterium]